MGPTHIGVEKSGQIKLANVAYYRCADVDGRRLDGAWTGFADPDDPDLLSARFNKW